ncbi:MAG TPA: 4Fe-4S binding protein [Syntrophales bacterium]|nr:4Fe-4S binding protein [Syntrophales bacterium]
MWKKHVDMHPDFAYGLQLREQCLIKSGQAIGLMSDEAKIQQGGIEVIELVNWSLCDGCNVCVDSCPTDVIKLVDPRSSDIGPRTWKAVIAYQDDCHSCRLCAIDCHVDAITVTHGVSLSPNLFTYREHARKGADESSAG